MKTHWMLWTVLGISSIALTARAEPEREKERIADAIVRAGENGEEIQSALREVPNSQRVGMRFLVANMPDRDLKELSAQFLLDNVELAYRAWNESPWREQVSEQMFLNNILPYASLNESRDDWRQGFYDQFKPLVNEAKTAGEAAATLNNKMFGVLNVRYSTKRRRADQGPQESIESGLASCTGLAILLVDACRSIGVPARFVGTPRWADNSGNHSWVEVWDDGWHFTGAAEPAGMKLDQAWFTARAARAKRDEPRYAIYAASFGRTPLRFPCVWDRRVDYVFAVNVTDRYAANVKELPVGAGRAMFRVLARTRGERVASPLRVISEDGEVLFEGSTRDERFDTNDHLTAVLPLESSYRVEVGSDNGTVATKVEFRESGQLFTFESEFPQGSESPQGDVMELQGRIGETQRPKAKAEDRTASDTAIRKLREYLAIPPEDRPSLSEQVFAELPLRREAADLARSLLWDDHLAHIKLTRLEEMEARVLRDGELEMPFAYRVFGDRPQKGRSLFISMHGGGGAPKRINDRQWENQKKLYEPKEGVYVAPRAPTDTWNLWHQPHIDRLFARLIEDMMAFEDVDPNRVYLMGYSAGGDGVYQLAPRMADRWAAAAMMAGHPNDAQPLSLRNIGFAIYVGGKDGAYKRNEVARQWKDRLAELHTRDPGGYRHAVEIYADKGHWMDREDAAAVPWMSQFTRDPIPRHVVWQQDDVRHRQFYWLAVDEPVPNLPSGPVVATYDGQEFQLDAPGASQLTIRLDDRMVDLDAPVRILSGQQVLFEGRLQRRIATLAKTLHERADPEYVFSSEVVISLLD